MMDSQRDDFTVYSLSQLAEGLRFAISRGFPDQIWVQAEIAKMNIYPRSGHVYLDLVDKEGGATRAQMRGIIWANDYPAIRVKFEDVTREPFREGLKILFLARFNFHATYGLSLWISDVEPSFTLGELSRVKTLTIARLRQESLFDQNKEHPIPSLPLRIAVISAETSKGYLDFLQVIRQHPVNYRFEITLFPALLQGDKAVESIREQLKQIQGSKFKVQGSSAPPHPNPSPQGEGSKSPCEPKLRSRVLGRSRREANLDLGVVSGIQSSSYPAIQDPGSRIQDPASRFDLVAIIRGVGDEIGLTCFDNYKLARDICTFPLPVITGIGHSTNETVVEMVAALNRITPTEVAYDLLARLDVAYEALIEAEDELKRFVTWLLTEKKEQLSRYSENLQSIVRTFIRRQRSDLEHHGKTLRILVSHLFSSQKTMLEVFERQVSHLDPKKILQRGYSMTYYQEGRILKDASAVNAGDKIHTELAKGKIKSTVDK